MLFSPDEKVLYVADPAASARSERAAPYPRLRRGGTARSLTNSRVFCDIKAGIPDGFRVDVNGNAVDQLPMPASNATHPTARSLGRIKVPEIVANVTFGGKRRNRLFITATTSLYAVYRQHDGRPTTRRPVRRPR